MRQLTPEEMAAPSLPDDCKPFVKLVGEDGNAFAIMGRIQSALRKAGCPLEKLQQYLKLSQSGDYSNLLAVAMEFSTELDPTKDLNCDECGNSIDKHEHLRNGGLCDSCDEQREDEEENNATLTPEEERAPVKEEYVELGAIGHVKRDGKWYHHAMLNTPIDDPSTISDLEWELEHLTDEDDDHEDSEEDEEDEEGSKDEEEDKQLNPDTPE